MSIAAIRESRTGKVQSMRQILSAAESEKRSLNPQEQSTFDKLKGEVVDLESQEQRAQFVEDMERRSMGVAVDKHAASLEKQITLLEAVTAQIEQRAATGALGEFNQEMARAGVTPRRGGILVPSSLFEQRATMTTTGAAAVVPDDYKADQFIGLFRNSMIVRSLGGRVLTGLRGDTTIPKQTGAGTAYWVAENAALTESSPTFDGVKLTPRHVGALSSVSRQLLQQANPSIEQLLRDDMVAVVGLAIDRAMLHGAAASDEPTGILNTVGIQTASLATLGWPAVVAMLEKLALENVTPNAIVTHAKAATKLQTTLKDAVAGAEYLLQGGRMGGLQTYVTNQLDAKAGSPVKGRVLTGDFSQMVFGEYQSAEILANPYAAGYYEKGAIQLRIMASLDMVVRNPKAFVLVDDLAL